MVENFSEEKRAWMINANAEYQKVMATLMTLATASLALPIFFIRNVRGVKEGATVPDQFMPWAIASWVSIFVSLGLAMLFSWASAKYVKKVYGGEEARTTAGFELIRDWSIRGMVAFFALGLVFALTFFTA